MSMEKTKTCKNGYKGLLSFDLFVCAYSSGRVVDITSSYCHCFSSLLLTVCSHTTNVALHWFEGLLIFSICLQTASDNILT